MKQHATFFRFKNRGTLLYGTNFRTTKVRTLISNQIKFSTPAQVVVFCRTGYFCFLICLMKSF